MSNAGRPTLYRRDYCDVAHNYCLLGATNEHLACFFDVTSRSIDNWIATHPEFAAAVKEGRAMADARVARGLYDRAVGYDHKVERTVWHYGRERKVSDTVHQPPDIRACIFWLRNRRRQTWRDAPNAATADDGIDDIARLEAASESVRHREADRDGD